MQGADEGGGEILDRKIRNDEVKHVWKGRQLKYNIDVDIDIDGIKNFRGLSSF